ncbi:MAG: 2-phospho-L-lactate guanylyltransferase [Acidobacteria bacterium]|nr:2-phospho-L-lactate guanylyltransferase [Acidobacteriota bacterium]
MRFTAVVPIRSFDGLTRLSEALSTEERFALMRRLAERTCTAIAEAGASVVIVTGDDEVRSWASESGFGLVDEPDPPGLDAAAAAGIAQADDAWMVVHADLPAIAPEDIEAAVTVLDGRSVLAPSHDGGTSLIAGSTPGFPFSYGVGSFHRHLAAVPDAAVLIRPGLALDLDRPSDLDAIRRLGFL